MASINVRRNKYNLKDEKKKNPGSIAQVKAATLHIGNNDKKRNLRNISSTIGDTQLLKFCSSFLS